MMTLLAVLVLTLAQRGRAVHAGHVPAGPNRAMDACPRCGHARFWHTWHPELGCLVPVGPTTASGPAGHDRTPLPLAERERCECDHLF